MQRSFHKLHFTSCISCIDATQSVVSGPLVETKLISASTREQLLSLVSKNIRSTLKSLPDVIKAIGHILSESSIAPSYVQGPTDSPTDTSCNRTRLQSTYSQSFEVALATLSSASEPMRKELSYNKYRRYRLGQGKPKVQTKLCILPQMPLLTYRHAGFSPLRKRTLLSNTKVRVALGLYRKYTGLNENHSLSRLCIDDLKSEVVIASHATRDERSIAKGPLDQLINFVAYSYPTQEVHSASVKTITYLQRVATRVSRLATERICHSLDEMNRYAA